DMDACRYFDFRIAGERDDKLPRRTRVPPWRIGVSGRRVARTRASRRWPHAEFRAGGLEHVCGAPGVQVQLNVFGVGQAVLSRKDACDHDGVWALRNRDVMIGMTGPERDEATNEDREDQLFRHEQPPDGESRRIS